MLVDVPMDIFSMEVDVGLFDRQRYNAKVLRKPAMDAATAGEIVSLLAVAKKPVIYAGGGVLLADAAEELRKLVDHLSLPVAHSAAISCESIFIDTAPRQPYDVA